MMEKYEYKRYLNTPEWKQKSMGCKQRAGYRCAICNGTSNLQAHHRTYVRAGNELPEDLTALCGRCHSIVHGRVAANDSNIERITESQLSLSLGFT